MTVKDIWMMMMGIFVQLAEVVAVAEGEGAVDQEAVEEADGAKDGGSLTGA